LVYGSRSEDIQTFASFEETWGDLTIWSCDSIHFQLEIPEYGVSKRIAERYHRSTTTILIPKSFEHILTVSLGDAIAKLFNLPQAGMDIDKVLCTCGDTLLLNDLFSSFWSLPALPLEWEEGLSKVAEIDEPAFKRETVDLTSEMEDVQTSTATNQRSFAPPPSFVSKGPYLATQTPSNAKVHTVVRSNAFRNLVTSMSKMFITMAEAEIPHRLPNHPARGVRERVNRGPISKNVLVSYTAELERTTGGSATLSVEAMEYTMAGIKSGLLGEYFVQFNHYPADQDLPALQ
jgi:WD40 repeat protein